MSTDGRFVEGIDGARLLAVESREVLHNWITAPELQGTGQLEEASAEIDAAIAHLSTVIHRLGRLEQSIPRPPACRCPCALAAHVYRPVVRFDEVFGAGGVGGGWECTTPGCDCKRARSAA